MSYTPKELVLSPHRIGVPYHCMHVVNYITVCTTAQQHWAHGTILKSVCGGGLFSSLVYALFPSLVSMLSLLQPCIYALVLYALFSSLCQCPLPQPCVYALFPSLVYALFSSLVSMLSSPALCLCSLPHPCVYALFPSLVSMPSSLALYLCPCSLCPLPQPVSMPSSPALCLCPLP